MHSDTITHRRAWAWLTTAMFPLLAHFSGGSWLAVLLLGIICCAALALIPYDKDAVIASKALCLLEYAWIILFLSQVIPISAQYWPGRGSTVVIPAVILLLAAYSNQNRPSAVAGVLFWVMVLLLTPILIAGAADVEPSRLAVRDMDLSALLIPTLLLPFAVRLIPTEQREGYGWYPWIILLAAVLFLVTNGVLSHPIASAEAAPFRELSRSLSFGSSARFESMVSVLITIGWFSLYSLLLRIAGVLGSRAGLTGNGYINAAIAFGLSWLLSVPDVLLIGATILLWIILPMISGKNFSQKQKKSIDK